MQRITIVTIALAAGFAGYVAGNRHTTVTAPVPPPQPQAVRAAPIATTIVREIERAPAREADAPALDEATPGPAPADTRDLERAFALVRSARQWTAREAGELRALLPRLDREQHEQVMTALVGALDGGQIVLDPALHGQPF